MKILICCKEPDYCFGGANYYLRFLIENVLLKNKNVQIDELCMYNIANKTNKDKLPINYIFVKNEPITDIPNFNNKPHKFFFDLVNEKKYLKSYLKNNKYDLIINNFPFSGGFKIDGIRVISIQHTAAKKFFSFPTRLVMNVIGLKSKFYYSNDIVNFTEKDTIEFKKYIKYNTINYHQVSVPNVSESKKDLNLSRNNNKDIVYIGRVTKTAKRIDKISKLSTLLKNKIVVYGDGEQKWINEITKTTDYRGFANKNEIKNILNNQTKAALLLSDYEGMPLVALEALSCGVPIILRDTFASASFLVNNHKNGILLDKDMDIKEIANILNEFDFNSFNKQEIINFYNDNLSNEIFIEKWKKIIFNK